MKNPSQKGPHTAGETLFLSQGTGAGGGSFLQKAATQLDFLDNDIGAANINIGSAAKLGGITSPADINHMAKYITTDEGTIDYAARFVAMAQADLAPFIKNMDARTQTQIIVDYVRQGPEAFWNRVMRKRNFNDEQFRAWKQAPDVFLGPDGKAPTPLMPNDKNFIPQHFEQIEKIIQDSRR